MFILNNTIVKYISIILALTSKLKFKKYNANRDNFYNSAYSLIK